MAALPFNMSVANVLRGYSRSELHAIIQKLTPREQAEVADILEWDTITRKEASFTAGPLYWLTECTKTEDLHAHDKGTAAVAPFPKKEYFIPVLSAMLNEPTLFIIKSREMMTSWLACGYVTWMCMTLPHMSWLMQSEKDDKVIQLVDYCRILYRNSPEWMKRKNPLTVDNVSELRWAMGGHVAGIPKGENQVRSYHPYGYLQDESAFLPEAEQCFNAVRPVCKQIIAISSDSMGWFHNTCAP